MNQNTVAAGEAEFDPARERTTLVNALAEAARAALDFDFMSAAVLGAIPGTEPQQYVIAGTPAGISKMLPTVAAPSPVSEAQAERVPGGTAEQQARYAIDGAIQFGRENRNAPPSTDHWLYEYWNIGQQLRELGKTGWDNMTLLDAPTAKEAEQASAQAVGWLYDWTHSSALGRPDEHFTSFTTDREDAFKHQHENQRLVYTAPAGAQAAAAEVRDAAIECWSRDEEDFNAQSLGDLLDGHNDLAPGSTVWVGDAVHPDPAQLVNGDAIIENISEAAYDIAGEHTDDYPDVTDEQTKELETLVADWIKRTCPPTFYTVKNIKPRVLTADDFAAIHSAVGTGEQA